SFGDHSHTFELAWYQPLPNAFAVTPSLRYYTQSAADFFFGPPFGNGLVPGEPYTADTRLSAFGAPTPSIRVDSSSITGGAPTSRSAITSSARAGAWEPAAVEACCRFQRAGFRSALRRRSDRAFTSAIGSAEPPALFRVAHTPAQLRRESPGSARS